MKQCRACGKVYPDFKRRCPHCGSFSRQNHVSILVWLRNNIHLLMFILFILILLWFAGH